MGCIFTCICDASSLDSCSPQIGRNHRAHAWSFYTKYAVRIALNLTYLSISNLSSHWHHHFLLDSLLWRLFVCECCKIHIKKKTRKSAFILFNAKQGINKLHQTGLQVVVLGSRWETFLNDQIVVTPFPFYQWKSGRKLHC